MRVRYTLRAFADREEIFDHTSKLSPNGAQAIKHDIIKAIRRLEQFPRSAPATDEPVIFELIVPRRPYKVYYRIEGREITDGGASGDYVGDHRHSLPQCPHSCRDRTRAECHVAHQLKISRGVNHAASHLPLGRIE